MLNNAFRVLISVRSKLFFSFLAMSALLALLGGYAFHAISTTGAVVENTFDRPLMAINYARSAGQTFTQMELDLVNGADRESLSETFETFQSDLSVAKNRSISERAAPFFEDVEKLTARWARMAMADQNALTEAESQQQAALASEIEDNLDIIVELQTNESFRNRETALEGVGKVESYALWPTGLALALSVLLSSWLGLTIIKPLKAAALAAHPHPIPARRQ